MTLNLIVIFNSITDVSFLRYVIKIFYISYYFQECFKVQLSVAESVYIVSSKGAIQLQVLYIRLWETSKETSCMESLSFAVLKCIPSSCFLEICRRFRTTSEKLVLENYVLPYHTADEDHTKILCKLSSKDFLCVFFVSYTNQNHKDTTHS